jgi:hypothetical protein
MHTSSAARQHVTYAPLLTLLIAGVLLLASVAPLDAEPAATHPVSSVASGCAAVAAPRSGFLLPTLAVSTPSAGPRLIVTETALRGVLPTTLAHTASQPQHASKPQKSWFGRNWWWVIPVGVVVTGVIVGYAYCSSNPTMCGD